MKEIVTGSPIRFDITASKGQQPVNIDSLAGLEYWIYTQKSGTIKKFSRDAAIGCIQMKRTDAENYYFYLDTKDMQPGVLTYEVYWAENNADITGGKWAPRLTVVTDYKLITKPISAK